MRRRVRVLCLHGSRQTADVLSDKMVRHTRFCSAVADFVFTDAPFLMPLVPDDEERMRQWNSDDRDDPRGGRYCVSVAAVLKVFREHECDVLLGFSQGCVVIAELLASVEPWEMQRLIGILFAGAPAVPHLAPPSWCRELPTMHIVGEKDAITPLDASLRFAHEWFHNPTIFQHSHAHSVPSTVDASDALFAFLSAFIDHTAERAEASAMLDDELQLLQTMFGEDEVTLVASSRSRGMAPFLSSGSGRRCWKRLSVRLPLSSANLPDGGRDLSELIVQLDVPEDYPHESPDIVVDEPVPAFFRVPGTKSVMTSLIADVLADVDALRGTPMLATVVVALRDRMHDFLERHGRTGTECLGNGCGDGDQSSPSDACWWGALDCEGQSQAERQRHIATAQQEACRLLHLPSTAEARGGPTHGSGGGNGGQLKLVVGLIGKPSAGKSTFFNAVTNPEAWKAAKVAAHPFTTIEPNVGTGFVPVPCPCTRFLGGADSTSPDPSPCQAEHGHVIVDGVCYRRHPAEFKDVAGLVQGAYQGRGKGNKFLNDLCDAHVLIHVVDGAAATDADGVACLAGEGSVCDDIVWVRNEVHSWVFDNLCAKWSSIYRRPDRLSQMFSGYQAPQTLVQRVLRICGLVTAKDVLLRVRTWTASDVHLLVAVFVALRFPVLTALNKADVPESVAVLQKLRAMYPREAMEPMSAQVECDVLHLRRCGVELSRTNHNTTENKRDLSVGPAAVAAPGAPELSPALDAIRQRVATFFEAHGGRQSGVHRVLLRAVELCDAHRVYVCADVRNPLAFPRCILMKRGSTVDDVFQACFPRSSCSTTPQQQHGERPEAKLVRFEYRKLATAESGDSEVRVLRRDEELPPFDCLVHLVCNQKSAKHPMGKTVPAAPS